MPLAAYGGRAELMRQVAPSGPVYQAGTFAAHPLAVAAGLATLDVIDRTPGLYDALEARGARLQQGLVDAAAAAGVPVTVQRVGSMWTVFFSATPNRIVGRRRLREPRGVRRLLPRHAGPRRAAAAVGLRVGLHLGGARRRRHRPDDRRGGRRLLPRCGG